MKTPYGIVYLTSRVENGVIRQRYVGQHQIKNAVIEDGYLGSGLKLKAAIKRFGKNNFVRETLEICYSQQELNDAEKNWVIKFNAVRDDNFYNVLSGGGGSPAQEDRVGKEAHQYLPTGEFVKTFTSLAEAAREVGVTYVTVGVALDHPHRTGGGYLWRSFKIEKISPQKVSNKQPVDCYNLSGKFIKSYRSLKSASQDTGAATANILHACSGRRDRAGKFQWRFKGDPKPVSSWKKTLPKTTRTVRKICPDSGTIIEEYQTITLASLSVKCNKETIRYAIKRNYVSFGYRWQYV